MTVSLPPAREPYACRRKDCAFPEGGRCAREAEFPDPVAQCVELEREAALAQDDEQDADVIGDAEEHQAQIFDAAAAIAHVHVREQVHA